MDDVASVRLPGCRLAVSLDSTIPFRTDRTGAAIVAVPGAALSQGLHAQAILLDGSSSASATVVAVSNRVQLAPGTPDTLPVFLLEAPPAVEPARMDGLLASVTHGRGSGVVSDLALPGSIGRRAGSMEVETYTASGGFFLRDADRLWNTELRPRVPSETDTRAIADGFLASNALLPTNDARVRVRFSAFTETGLSLDLPGPVTTQVLDRQANYDVELLVQSGGRLVSVPVVGGGGNFKVSVGDGGDIVGYHGVWRPIRGVVSQEPILSKSDAEALYRANARELDLLSVDASLAYYSAPAFEKQTYLAPVWVVRAVANIAGIPTPVRSTFLAATRYGPSFGAPSADAAPRSSAAPATRGGFRAGTWWLGSPFGLPGSQGNAAGFHSTMQGMASLGWTVAFDFGNQAAWESDWRLYDDNYVDTCNLVFYTGHANQFGWQLATGDGFLHQNEIGSQPENPGDFYGQQQMDWLIIAACGPHQSTHFRSAGTTNAFDRWRGIFDGLHTFMGYGAVTYDNSTEGGRVAQLAGSGWPIIDAWFRTALEVQPTTNGLGQPDGPTIYVTAMYAANSLLGTSIMRNDRIWGTGFTSPDGRIPYQARAFVFTGT
ncbi:MAG: hypothetical protein IPM29_31090 [Planctomycetes bacterium]|nr:hypothetical protein [Planctomycetota bacterium]